MTDPDDQSVLRETGVTATVSDDVWSRALAVAFDPDAHVSDSSMVPVMDDSGDLPDTSSDDTGASIAHHTDHDGGGHLVSGHDAVDLGGSDHEPVHHDETHHDSAGHDIDHGHDDGHDPHDAGWHV